MTARDHPDAPSRIPVSSYRLQFNRGFTFVEATALVPYLADLGVTECYASPLLTASPGSTHGYDICDHSRLNPELGGEEAFAALTAALRRHDLGLILDVVPNHMGIDPRTNRWWHDVLENGPSSPWASFFDVDWLPVKPELRDKVLLPILGDQYGQVLERGELQLHYTDGVLELSYFDHLLPVNPRQAIRVYRHGLDDLRVRLGDQDPDVRELMSVITALGNLPPYTERDPGRIEERQREKEVARERLRRLTATAPVIRDHIEAAVRRANGVAGHRASYDLLHELLEAQAYRLAYWRTAFDEINYRRFFDINQLAALRMEDPRVFTATHGLILRLVAEGQVTGIRVDHPDGLFDPAAYFNALQREARQAGGPAERPLYVVAEKILSHGEALPSNWAVHGTTGYNFLNVLNGLFVRREGLQEVRRSYREFARQRRTTSDVVHTSKRDIIRTSLASELNVLAHALNRLSEADRRTRDFTLNTLRRVLAGVVASFPVYRTYITADGARPEDERVIDAAIADAHRRDPVRESSIFAFLRAVLLPSGDDLESGATRQERTVFAMKLQQYTGPVEAKGLEDTAFYRRVPLISVNEVGADPHHAAWTTGEFHDVNRSRLARWPFEMTTSATHDTKRGEDARLRIDVLSEFPLHWRRLVARWSALNDVHRQHGTRPAAPDRNDEWLFYQALLGAWPAEPADAPVPSRAADALVERLTAYMLKAVKEAKRHTSWVNANAAYDDATAAFVTGTLTGSTAARFLALFVPFQRRLAWFGMLNSLGHVVLKLASPGMPDIYQGCELWDLSLVDPDNRRPVDFVHRRAMLASLEPILAASAPDAGTGGDGVDLSDLLTRWWDGRAKLLTTAAALRLRRAHPDVFLTGDYQPLDGDGTSGHLISFARQAGDTTVVAMVPRFLATRLRGRPRLPLGPEVWQTSRVPLPKGLSARGLMNVFTGERVTPLVHRGEAWLLAADVFTRWPVALLVATDA